MIRKTTSFLIGLLLMASMSMLMVNVAHATNDLIVTPGSAFVGTFRTIMAYVHAWDDAWGIWEVGLCAENIPSGVSILFDPSFARLTGSITSTMYVRAGVGSIAGTYTITIVARWTTIIGTWWERRTTFTLEVRTTTEGEWTLNPSLIISQDKWRPRCTQWNWYTGEYWEVPNDQYHYVRWWADGRVDMMATDFVSDTIDEVGDFTQGNPDGYGYYQPPPVTLNPCIAKVTLRAAAYNIHTNIPYELSSWTGIKFDATAKSTVDNRILYIEMYFVRTGTNLLWPGIYKGNSIEVLKVADDADNYMVDITNSMFASYVQIVTSGGVTYYTIDLSYFFLRASLLYSINFPDIWSGRSIDDYQLVKAGPCLEAAWLYLGGPIIYPQCSITFSNIEVKGSYLTDVNCDGMTNILDLAMAAQAYGSELGDSSYLPNADINFDKIIDITDITTIGSYSGKTFP